MAGLRPKAEWGRCLTSSGSGGRAPAEDRVGRASGRRPGGSGVSGSGGRAPTEGEWGRCLTSSGSGGRLRPKTGWGRHQWVAPAEGIGM